MKKDVVSPGAAEGERSSTGAAPEVKRWSSNRKKEVVLRLLRGEPVDTLSRELGIEIYRLEGWHKKALQSIDTALKAREGDPLHLLTKFSLKREFRPWMIPLDRNHQKPEMVGENVLLSVTLVEPVLMNPITGK